MKKSLCFLSICFAAFACCSACIQHNNPENPSDPKTEIIKAVKDAALPVYFEETIAEANGKAMRRKVAATFIYVTHDSIELRGGEQENVGSQVMGIIIFTSPLMEVPDALYLGGENGEGNVKVEKIEMVAPELAVVTIGGGFAGLKVKPILMAGENLDGALADSYLVDLKTIQGGQMAIIDVRRAEEVENNLEKFAEKCFLDLVFQQKQVFATGVSQVLKAVADGGSYPKVYYERLIQFGGKK